MGGQTLLQPLRLEPFETGLWLAVRQQLSYRAFPNRCSGHDKGVK